MGQGERRPLARDSDGQSPPPLDRTRGSRFSVAARLGLCLLLLSLRAVDAPAAWDGLCRSHSRYHLTTGYLLWKHLGVGVDEQVLYAGLGRDGDLDGLVQGKSLDELREMFPELQVGGTPTWLQASYEHGMRSYWTYDAPDRDGRRELYWLGSTTWGVVLRDGRGEELGYWKG